jgi:hypothetical protein
LLARRSFARLQTPAFVSAASILIDSLLTQTSPNRMATGMPRRPLVLVRGGKLRAFLAALRHRAA